jgi:hypothetical protein
MRNPMQKANAAIRGQPIVVQEGAQQGTQSLPARRSVAGKALTGWVLSAQGSPIKIEGSDAAA